MLFRPLRFCLTYSALLVLCLLSVPSAGLGPTPSGYVASLGVIPLLIAALREGAYFAARQPLVPSSSALWRAAMQMSFLTAGTSFLLLAGAVRVIPGLAQGVAQMSPLVWAAVLVTGFAGSLAVTRLGFALGAKRQHFAQPAPA